MRQRNIAAPNLSGRLYDRSRANRGKPFEEFLRFAHEAYERKGVAVVHKVPTEFIPLRNARGEVCNVKVERKSCVDYLGRYGPTPVAIEAKHTEDGRIRFDRVEDHQAKYLDIWEKDPQAVGIVLVSFGLRRFFAVPWKAWKAARDQCAATPPRYKPASVSIEHASVFWDTPRAASVSADELPNEWEIKSGGATGLPYLEIIDQWRGDNG